MEKLDQSFLAGKPGKDLAVAKRPVLAASGSRACGTNERTPEDDEDDKQERRH